MQTAQHAGLTEALPPVQTTHLAAITEPKEIGRLLRDIEVEKSPFLRLYAGIEGVRNFV